MVTEYSDTSGQVIAIAPNCSATWSQNKRFLMLMAIPSMAIALGWLFMGVWIILPLAGFELSLVGYFMYRVCYKNHRRHLIIVDDEKVRVQGGVFELQEFVSFPRHTSHIAVTKPVKPYDMVKLHLVEDEQNTRFELGDFLNADDRKELRKKLKSTGLPEQVDRWWETD